MKTLVRRILAVAGLLVMGGAAALHAQTPAARTTVPFEFVVGTTTLPRGTYLVSKLPGQGHAFLIQGLRHSAIVIAQPEWAGRDRDSNLPHLVFHRYGNQYFLRAGRRANDNSVSLPGGRAETDAAEGITSASEIELVTIAAR